jgi:hypothetical protein
VLYSPEVFEPQQTLRHYCRNPKCRSKLRTPVADPREAFCTKGCYTSFYRQRCRVCEELIAQPKHGVRAICNKAKCRDAWAAKTGLAAILTRAATLVAQHPKAPREVPNPRALFRASKPTDHGALSPAR